MELLQTDGSACIPFRASNATLSSRQRGPLLLCRQDAMHFHGFYNSGEHGYIGSYAEGDGLRVSTFDTCRKISHILRHERTRLDVPCSHC